VTAIVTARKSLARMALRDAGHQLRALVARVTGK
jgi:hypothetical protein